MVTDQEGGAGLVDECWKNCQRHLYMLVQALIVILNEHAPPELLFGTPCGSPEFKKVIYPSQLSQVRLADHPQNLFPYHNLQSSHNFTSCLADALTILNLPHFPPRLLSFLLAINVSCRYRPLPLGGRFDTRRDSTSGPGSGRRGW